MAVLMPDRYGSSWMACTVDAQHRVIDHPVTIRVGTHRFWQDSFDFLRHHAELAAMAPLIAEFRLVIEQVEADAERVVADADEVFFDALV